MYCHTITPYFHAHSILALSWLYFHARSILALSWLYFHTRSILALSFLLYYLSMYFVQIASGEQSAQRHIWLLTYGAGGANIDASTFSEYGRLAVDECYTTIDRALKYTLIRLKTKNRDTALRKFMIYCSQKYAIVEQEIFGYSSVSANSTSSELFEHPAFRVLVQHKAESRPCFSWWVETPGLRGGGILASYSRRVSPSVPVTTVTDQDKESEESEPETVEGGSVAQVLG